MNYTKRRQLRRISSSMNKLLDDINDILQEEENSLSNIPVTFYSRIDSFEESVEELSDISDDLNEIIERINHLSY